jgi:hypothetical protein
MNPMYQVNGMVSYDDPRFTKPRKPLPFFPDSALLRTADIMAPSQNDLDGLRIKLPHQP